MAAIFYKKNTSVFYLFNLPLKTIIFYFASEIFMFLINKRLFSDFMTFILSSLILKVKPVI